jgi:SAM-dependent methyltransferase
VNILEHNREAWNRQVRGGNPWTVPVTREDVARARRGDWSIVLTSQRPVPRSWFPPLPGCNVLCLAGGGGQQGPILAASGADVTVFDLSPLQLARDREVAQREGLELRIEEGDMANLSRFPAESFDLIVHPTSNVYVPDVRRVWREAFRVLRPGGTLLSGFLQPTNYAVEEIAEEPGTYRIRHAIPFSDTDSLSTEELQRLMDEGDTLQWSHTLEDQLGGQTEAGFLIAGLYEDRNPYWSLAHYLPTHMATRAIKPQRS